MLMAPGRSSDRSTHYGQNGHSARVAVGEKYPMEFVSGRAGVDRETILRVLDRAVVGEV